jgi:predicted ATPase
VSRGTGSGSGADLLVVTGPPGAGKSSVAALLVRAFPTAALVPGDAVFGFWTQGFVDPWLPAAAAQNELVLRAAGACAGTLAAGGCTAVYEGVLGPWLLPVFTAAAGPVRLHYAVLLPPLATCLERVAGRPEHGFRDADAAAHMHAEFAAALGHDRHVVDREGTGTVQDTADAVLAAVRTGRLLTAGGMPDRT